MGYRVPGPCTIQFDNSDIGVTKAGVIIRPTTGLLPVTDDDHGAEPATYIFGGKGCIVEVIGLDLTSIKAADIWAGSVLQNAAGLIGSLASDLGKELDILERDGTSHWIAAKAFPTDPRELGLRSTQEIHVPLTFVIVPVSGVLFQTVPSYIWS